MSPLRPPRSTDLTPYPSTPLLRFSWYGNRRSTPPSQPVTHVIPMVAFKTLHTGLQGCVNVGAASERAFQKREQLRECLGSRREGNLCQLIAVSERVQHGVAIGAGCKSHNGDRTRLREGLSVALHRARRVEAQQKRPTIAGGAANLAAQSARGSAGTPAAKIVAQQGTLRKPSSEEPFGGIGGAWRAQRELRRGRPCGLNAPRQV